MKTKIISIVGVFLISVSFHLLDAQTAKIDKKSTNFMLTNSTIPPDGIGMKKYVLESRVQDKVLLDIDDKSAELIADGIESIELTKLSIVAMKNGKKDDAIDYIAGAMGKLETVALRNPDMGSIPISRLVQTDDIDTDLGAIRIVKEGITKALERNKFHLARKELESLISEVKIETRSIPISTYPDALKESLLAIEKNDTKTATSVLEAVLNTMIVDKQYISLPCMRAEVLLEESLTIQPGHTDSIANRKLLLESAKNQIQIAYELGQIMEESSLDIIDEINEAYRSIGTVGFSDKVNKVVALIADTKNEYDNNEDVEI